MPKKVAAIDGNSLMHRAYHGIQTPMTAPDGTPTNAVFGFLSMLLKFIEIAHPDAIVCAFDCGKSTFRMAELEQYKAQRQPMDEELRVQFPIIEEILASMSIPVIKEQGWEGDDILGTIAARDETLGYETLLVTSDKDACQLATNLTHIVTTKRGITDVVIYGPDEVAEKYGVTPEQFPDFLGLMGDASDNIPGVAGIGAKKAADLLQRFGSLQGVYDNLGELKGKMLENLEQGKEAAFLSRRIATIVCDLDFTLDLEATSFPSFDVESLQETFQKYALNSQLNRVLKLVDVQVMQTSADIDPGEIVTGIHAEQLVVQAIARGERVGVSFGKTEEASLFSEVAVAFSTTTGTALFEGDKAYEVLVHIIEDGSFAALDVKHILHQVLPPDTASPALIDFDQLEHMSAFDAGLAAYVLDSSAPAATYTSLAETYLGGVLDAAEDDLHTLALQAACIRQCVEPLRDALEKTGVTCTYYDIDLPLVAVLAAMERTGAAINADKLQALGVSTQVELDKLAERIYALAGEDFNIDSPKQLSHILFEVLGLTPTKKTQSGYSTDASVLKELAKVHELPEQVIHYRELAKIKSTYIDALPRMRARDERIHTQFNETVTTTGRLSSSDPNLQNIPVRTEFGRQIRACFIPLKTQSVFMSADYSQIELRVLAHLSGDTHLIEAFKSGEDFHAQTASRVFDCALDAVTPEMRSRAKAVNFGIVYGQQAFGLAQSLGISRDEARDMIDRYFAAYPDVKRYLKSTVEFANNNGYAETLFGRRRYIPELRAKNVHQRGFGERTAMNHPMQGTAADIIKLAMREVAHRLDVGNFEAELMIQVHDELDLSVPQSEIEEVAALVRSAMEGVVQLEVPLVVDVNWGATWADAH